jgi:hypothetical protein
MSFLRLHSHIVFGQLRSIIWLCTFAREFVPGCAEGSTLWASRSDLLRSVRIGLTRAYWRQGRLCHALILGTFVGLRFAIFFGPLRTSGFLPEPEGALASCNLNYFE